MTILHDRWLSNYKHLAELAIKFLFVEVTELKYILSYPPIKQNPTSNSVDMQGVHHSSPLSLEIKEFS